MRGLEYTRLTTCCGAHTKSQKSTVKFISADCRLLRTTQSSCLTRSPLDGLSNTSMVPSAEEPSQKQTPQSMVTAPPSVNCAFAPVPHLPAKPATITPINEPNLAIPFRLPHNRPPSIRIRKLLRRCCCRCSRFVCSALSVCPSVRVFSHLLRLRFAGGVMPSMPKRQQKTELMRMFNLLQMQKKK